MRGGGTDLWHISLWICASTLRPSAVIAKLYPSRATHVLKLPLVSWTVLIIRETTMGISFGANFAGRIMWQSDQSCIDQHQKSPQLQEVRASVMRQPSSRHIPTALSRSHPPIQGPITDILDHGHQSMSSGNRLFVLNTK